MIAEIRYKMKKHQFLFEELVKRDFKQKYKRTILGMGWSIMSPLLTLFVLNIIFSYFFGQQIPHYPIYLFCGNLLFSYFNEATNGGMYALLPTPASSARSMCRNTSLCFQRTSRPW